jgi:2-polyprenyl-6-hydroxyphenyl methylase/3-demethylubiquinone-9 3-methyltransferase
MMELLPAVISPSVPCKCCSGEAKIFGVVDFNQTCAQRISCATGFPEIPIYYHRCRSCGFLFTVAFDNFSRDDFAKWIYNEQYKTVDPDYDELRPHNAAAFVAKMFEECRDVRILDYGAGTGRVAGLLKADGFKQVDSYDPFVPEFSARPTSRYDVIISFEVAEHCPHPAKLFQELDSLVKPEGMILFSTQLQPPEIEQIGVNWWYIGPRNGHVSIYTKEALAKLTEPMGWRLISFNVQVHALSRRPIVMRPLTQAEQAVYAQAV